MRHFEKKNFRKFSNDIIPIPRSFDIQKGRFYAGIYKFIFTKSKEKWFICEDFIKNNYHGSAYLNSLSEI